MSKYIQSLIAEIKKLDASVMTSVVTNDDKSLTTTIHFLDTGRKFRMKATREQVIRIYETELGIDKYIVGMQENATTIRVLLINKLMKSETFQQYVTARKAVDSSYTNAN